MTVKIVCPCETRIAFDVEPENGRMPVPVACPGCGADATALADAFIAAHTPSVMTPPTGPMRVSLRAAEPEPPVAPANPGESAAPPEKPRSLRDEAINRARIASEATRVLTEERASDKDFAFLTRYRLLIRLALVALVAAFGGWVWFKLVASKPRVVFTMTAHETVGVHDAQLVGDRQLLVLTPQRLSLQDWRDDREVWSVALTSPAPARPRAKGSSLADDLLLDDSSILLRVAGSSVWLARDKSVARYELTTGTKKAEVNLPQSADSFQADDRSITAISRTGPNLLSVTRVDFGSGKAATETYTETVPPPRRRPAPTDDEDGGGFFGPSVDTHFIPAGSGLVAFETELLEHRIVTATGAQPESERRKTPLLERENLRAADSTEAAAEFLNQGGSAVERDESRYRVKLQRMFGGGAGWSGNVVGRPSFHAFPELDFLAAGTELRALGKDGRTAWTAQLSHPVAGSDGDFGDDDDGVAPIVLNGSRTYAVDRGTLTALDTKTGKVAWRLPSVGISQVLPVGDALYVATTSAGPEALKFKEGFRLNDRTYPIVLKVEAATGKVLWSFERLADRVVANGGFIYGMRSATSAFEAIGAASENRDPAVTFSLRRLEPTEGKMMWNWSQKGSPRDVAARRNVLLVRNATEVKLLRFAAW